LMKNRFRDRVHDMHLPSLGRLPRVRRPNVPVASPRPGKQAKSHAIGMSCDTAEGGVLTNPAHWRGGLAGALFSKFAQTVTSPFTVTLHAPGPLHPPPQPTKTEPAPASWDRSTVVPIVAATLQAPGQSIDPCCERTRPLP
jgi:hypothetical protein